MLKRYESEAGMFEFVRPTRPRRSSGNIFTAVVGRNGTGKSRLLRGVVRNLITETINPKVFSREEQANFKTESVGILEIAYKPSQIICVSASPFDKFPLLRREQFVRGYSYLGLRGLPSSNLGLAYMSRIISALIQAAENIPGQTQAIAHVLETSGYKGGIHITLQKPPPSLLQRLLAPNPRQALEEYTKSSLFLSDGISRYRQLLIAEPKQFDHIVRIARHMMPRLRGRSEIGISIDRNSVGIDFDLAINRKDWLQLLLSGLFRLKDVMLVKQDGTKPIKLHEASSGEQAVLMSLLGIGSQIQDGALICIDEPEVCLHPEWQEKYIEVLAETFQQFHGCHFLIATHSPQIVAQMPKGDCFVTSMEDRVARHAREFTNRSIDFQLAEVFAAPGYKNEYLCRIALNAFAMVSKEKKVNSEVKQTLRTLRRLTPELHGDDPLRELISTLEDMAKTYG